MTTDLDDNEEAYCVDSGAPIRYESGDRCIKHGAAATPCYGALRAIPKCQHSRWPKGADDRMTTDLDALAALRAAATPLPWRTSENAPHRIWSDRDPAGFDAFHVADCLDALGHIGPRSEADAAFIVAACNALPSLIAEIHSLREELGR